MQNLSDEARKDLDKLIAALVPFAQQMLSKRGRFFPFGAAMKPDGEVVLMAGDPGEGDQPPSNAIIDTLVAGMRKQASTGELRATGICYDAKLQTAGDKGAQDAICVQLEHGDGGSIIIALKYRRGLLRRYRYDTPLAVKSEPRVFATPA